MPRGDGTGPRGQGPMTGRAAGFCAGYETPGFANPQFGRGGGMGYGRGFGGGGRGWRHGFNATGLTGWQRFGGAAAAPVPEPRTERLALQRQAEALQSELDGIKKRLAAIEDGPQEG